MSNTRPEGDDTSRTDRPPSRGTTSAQFQPVRDRFDQYLAEEPGLSMQLSIYCDGLPVADLVGGPNLMRDSLTGVYSVSKAASAFVIGGLLDQGSLELDRPVVDYWPEFGQANKHAVTVRQVLSHQSGLVGVSGGFSIQDVLHSGSGAAKLAAQRPLWQPGSAFGYHALTIGILMEELVRRVSGQTLQALYETQVRASRKIDFYLGLPADQEARYVAVEDAVLTERQQGEVDAQPPRDAVAELAFGGVAVPPGLGTNGMSTNNPLVRRSGPAAVGGVASAAGLAQLFSYALGIAGDRIVSGETLNAMSQQQSWGIDRVLNVTNAFGTVFLLPQPRMPYGSHRAFGHDGAAGALAFADPSTGLAFGYIPYPTQYPGGADYRSVALARIAADCAGGTVTPVR